jgi:putative transposase
LDIQGFTGDKIKSCGWGCKKAKEKHILRKKYKPLYFPNWRDMLMEKDNGKQEKSTGKESWSILEEIARTGARKMLQQALEQEVEEYLLRHADDRDNEGKRNVVRNGYHPEREILSGIGPLSIKQPRIDDRGKEQRFSSTLLPKYMRRMPSVDNLIPCLYLKGISTGDFTHALSAILGEVAAGLSATNVVRLKQSWEAEYRQWTKRDLSDKEYVYMWVDGIYFNVRLDDERSCILVIMGADKEGKKELVAVSDGYRESKLSWQEMLRDLKLRGLEEWPRLVTGDGALGFWAAQAEEFPETKRQRCWVHKSANILDKMPKSIQSKAKSHIHDMYMAETKAEALKAYDHFVSTYGAKYEHAVKCLTKDKEDLFTFYDFPGAHWRHIRTTNPIESTFATVRLRTKRTKGCGSRTATLSMVWKLVKEAEKNWQKLHQSNIIALVLADVKFEDGEEVKQVS